MTQEKKETTPEKEEEKAELTLEEQLEKQRQEAEDIRKQLEETQKENDRLQGGYKGLQKTLNEKDSELKKRSVYDSRIDALEDSLEIIAAAIATGARSIDDVDESQRKDVVAELKRQKAGRIQKEAEARQDAEREEYNRKANEIYAKAKEIFKDDLDSFERVEDLLYAGRLERAEERVSRAEEKTKKTSGDEKLNEKKEEESEEAVEDKIREAAIKMLEEQGLRLEFDTTPSASASDAVKAMSDYNKGLITAEEAKKRGAKFD